MKYSKETNKIIQDIGLDEKNDCVEPYAGIDRRIDNDCRAPNLL